MTDEQAVKQMWPTAKLVGPSGDGCHVEVNGSWFAYGNIPANAWKNAVRMLPKKPENDLEIMG